MDYFSTHLCGNMYDKSNQCEHFVYANQDDMVVGKKKLKKYYVYCTANGGCRSMGCSASWTGNSPTWCPKRTAVAQSNSIDEENNK